MPQLTEQSRFAAGSHTTSSLVVSRALVDPVLAIRAVRFTSSDGFYVRYLKRVFDLVLGFVLLLVSAPVVLVAALAVLMTSGWPAFYASERAGKDGRTFRMWKLRTMCRDADAIKTRWSQSHPELYAEYVKNQKLRDDPRTTAVGRLLRRTSVDELPQLWNVVRGDMALVGPRPYLPSELAGAPEACEYVTRVRPGITGPWQVGGRNRLSPRVRMAVDRFYVSDQGFLVDLGCLWRTFKVLIYMDGR